MTRKIKRKTGWFWAAALLFAAGYLATRLMIAWRPAETPAVTTGLLVALTIPFAARARRLLRGALRGLGLGLAGSAGLGAALLGPLGASPFSAALIRTSAAVVMICCTLAGGIFALLAERRRRKIEGL